MRTPRVSIVSTGCSVLLAAWLITAAWTGSSHAAPRPSAGVAAELAFRDAVHEPPTGWSGPRFRLSHNYPHKHPGRCPKSLCTWLDIDVDFRVDFNNPPPDWTHDKWDQYMTALLDYVKQGQDPQLANEVGFRVEVDGKTRWFHVPWMAYDPTVGREFIHGTTSERAAYLSDFIGDGRGLGGRWLPEMDEKCKEKFPHGFETWSVGFYNEWGGWALGQSWPESGRPDIGTYLGTAMPQGLPFPEGTVVAKILTTNAPVECVPYLKGSPEWQIHRHKIDPETRQYLCEREVQISRLVQMDVATVDVGTATEPRSPTRWVYGTFAYNGELEGKTVWERMAPVGVQWGSDPWTFPAVPESENILARQSVLNHGIGIFEHEGCHGRLAGPVDNPQSSCLSCHGSAYAAPRGAPSIMGTNAPASFGFDGLCTQYSQENVDYFQNLLPPQGYPGGRFPDGLNLDTSMQMWVALTQYGFFHTDGRPQACTNPDQF